MKKLFYLFISISLLCVLTSCNSLRIQECLPIYAMDTTIQITFYNVEDYQMHYKKIKEIYYLYDDISSDFEEDNGLVYRLNQDRSLEASSELVELILEAIRLKEDTNGYYNPLIGRLSHLWKDAIKESRILDEDIILEELDIMNQTTINIEGNMVSLIGEANLDLGGIAKGYATQKAYEYLKSENINSFLINAGNSNVVFGTKNKDTFKIGLEAPYENKIIKIVEDKNKAIGTSSGKYQYAMIEGTRYHHLLNPFTGMPSNLYDNINVMCENSMLCDVYSTAIFSMDLDMAKAFILEKNIDVILFKDSTIIYQTDGWNVYE